MLSGNVFRAAGRNIQIYEQRLKTEKTGLGCSGWRVDNRVCSFYFQVSSALTT